MAMIGDHHVNFPLHKQVLRYEQNKQEDLLKSQFSAGGLTAVLLKLSKFQITASTRGTHGSF